MPTRFESQKDALGVIANAKTEQNQENTIGLISMGGDGKADVLVNCTSDVGKVLSAADKMKIDGKADILVALQTAQLALKHRKNKKQDQRIILFVGSPVDCSEKLLIKAGKRLKKNNVAVDIINFGEVEQNISILESFLNAVNSNDNSHLVTVPTSGLISEAIVSSPIFSQQGVINEFAGLGDNNIGGGMGANANVGVGAGGDLGAMDINDPELAMAIRMSLEAERQRREVEAKQATDESLQTAQQQPQPHEPMNIDQGAGGNIGGNVEDDDEAELLRAMQMSMNEDQNQNEDVTTDEHESKIPNVNVTNENANNQTANTKQPSGDIDAMLNNEAFMDELLSNLPGIRKEDININEILGINKEDNTDDKNKDKNKDDKDKKR